MENTYLIITSIENQTHPVLNVYAKETSKHNVSLIVIGDTKSPKEFNLDGCDFYSIECQQDLKFQLAKSLPVQHYARKNLGYLIAISKGAKIIIETDDDNLPLDGFWEYRTNQVNAHLLCNEGWVNVYKYFTESHIWPRGYALEYIQDKLPTLDSQLLIDCPIQQGLADGNPDVDAIYRLTMPLPIVFNKANSIALGNNSICPFNSQNTTWFKKAFPLLYLPSYCSFRMTDIWRSFVAQRIAWSCNWSILFHHSTVWQERNDHSLMNDFREEILGYTNNSQIVKSLNELDLKDGVESIADNMRCCYNLLIKQGFVDQKEADLLDAWLKDVNSFK